jgi:hypothetical protein
MLSIKCDEEVLFHYYMPPIKRNLETKEAYTLQLEINRSEITLLKMLKLFPFSSNSKAKSLIHLRRCSCFRKLKLDYEKSLVSSIYSMWL